MNGAQMADMMFSAITGTHPFGQQVTPRWKVCYEDPETREEKEVTVPSNTIARACSFVQEEYGDVLSITRIK